MADDLSKTKTIYGQNRSKATALYSACITITEALFQADFFVVDCTTKTWNLPLQVVLGLNVGWNFFLFFNFDALPAIQVQEISPNIAFDNRIRARSNESILLELHVQLLVIVHSSQLHLFSGTALPSAICKIKILDTFKTAVNTHFFNLAFKWIFFTHVLIF